MDLKIFFEPLPEALYLQPRSHNAFFEGINCHGEHFPSLQGIQLAIIGLEEYRGSEGLPNGPESAYAVREKLYRLKKGQGLYKIADLGTLRSGETQKETCQLIRSIGEFLINQEILPIFIGGSHDLDFGQYLAYEKMRKMISVLTVDAKMDMEDNGTAAQTHSQQIVLHRPNFIFNYCHLAYQSFLTDTDLVATLEKLYFDHVRLGKLRDNFQEVEPLIRNADMVSFDLCAVKSTDAPGAIDGQPFGMTSEEACQVSWFAGTNEKLSSVGFYGYHSSLDDARYSTASVLATMVWYFIEGFYQRKDSLSFKSSDYTMYTVSMDASPSMLHFYKSNRSGKWWMEVPVADMGKFGDHTIIPCSYEDYQVALRGEIPERWVNAQLKLP
ncbi:hypothetical protein ADIS_1749 [Lunatimonas lonarensis]|uniref:Formiminoglutamase n=1 Tax=Lunatimonas lonarensis TaxID=1232681 RepID=R7ZUK1_9BACT|nr:formimidoylglutamase [Lunatimonas lonarensis]EON77830.1 hypothetical protein ADIS_1749 [Lunatimonas lonarensis]